MATTSSDQKIDRFALLAATLTSAGNLAEPALLLAEDEYPGIDILSYLARLDDLADSAISVAIADAESDTDAACRLAHFLACDQGFAGNVEHYYDPANSFMNEVLDRRLGIPITLSLLLVEVGKRLGLPLVGIGFPCHFLTGCLSDGPGSKPAMLIDPFHGGEIVSEDECRARLDKIGIIFNAEEHLQPIDDRQFLVRMLANLKAVYIQKGDIERAIWAIKRQTQLDPRQSEGYRLLGLQLSQSDNNNVQAQSCLRSYLEIHPDTEHGEQVRAALSKCLDRQARRN